MFVKKVFIAALACFLTMAVAQEQEANPEESYLVNFSDLGSDTDDMYNGNWKVRLNSSSDFLMNRRLSYAKNAEVRGTTNKNLFESGAADGNVFGIRINFPNMPANAYAEVTPPVAIKYFNGGNDPDKFVGNGLIKNAGAIKSIKVYIKGKGYPFSLYVTLKNRNDEKRAYYLGHLNFHGWDEMVFNNPNYISNPRNIDYDKKGITPLYPQEEPYIMLDSISFFRHQGSITGDFVAYIAWVKVEYDKGIIRDENDDIDDEGTWEILKERREARSKVENSRQGQIDDLRRRELAKKGISEDSPISEANSDTVEPTGGAEQ